MNPIFRFEPEKFRPLFERDGHVHVRGALAPGFQDLIQEQVDELLENAPARRRRSGELIEGLFRFPDEQVLRRFAETIAIACGLDPSKIILSARQIQCVDPSTGLAPQPRKERYSAQVSVSIPVRVPAESTLVLYPHDEVSVNPFDSVEHFPDSRLEEATSVEIQELPGDMMIFRGNSIRHLRRPSGRTALLYVALNDFGCDTLGADPSTDVVRERTLQALGLADDQLAKLIPVIGRGVRGFQRRIGRDWTEQPCVALAENGHLALSEAELKFFRSIDVRASVAELVSGSYGQGVGIANIRRLAARGALELLEPAADEAAARPGLSRAASVAEDVLGYL